MITSPWVQFLVQKKTKKSSIFADFWRHMLRKRPRRAETSALTACSRAYSFCFCFLGVWPVSATHIFKDSSAPRGCCWSGWVSPRRAAQGEAPRAPWPQTPVGEGPVAAREINLHPPSAVSPSISGGWQLVSLSSSGVSCREKSSVKGSQPGGAAGRTPSRGTASVSSECPGEGRWL